MSLATRCPACGTVFRVVQDQLRISEGWVRCGRCNGVFDATEVLFDIDQGTPVRLDLAAPLPAGALPTDPLPADPGGPAPRAPAPARQPAGPGPLEATLTITDWQSPLPGRASVEAHAARADAEAAWPLAAGVDRDAPGQPRQPWPAGLAGDPGDGAPLLRMASADATPAALAADDDEIRIVDALPMGAAGTADAPAAASTATRSATAADTEPGSPWAADPAGLPAPMAAPGFIRAAERAAWWRRPTVRAGLGAGVLLLALLAVLQAALLERDLLAARAPATAPLLQALCRPWGCQVQAPRRIEALSVESSHLGRMDTPGLYRLQLALRNRADIALLAPALELSLTDGQGRLVVRRVLQVQDLGLAATALPPGQAVTMQAILSAGAQRIDGYAVELFYP